MAGAVDHLPLLKVEVAEEAAVPLMTLVAVVEVAVVPLLQAAEAQAARS